ncbi:MAG TPA: S1 RNA-binding domain-containing protein [Streptosporangiaceae bacterium]|nr:S1 RNA-binding domain-containing protein [Streptosporangiaceae bacterium]
MLTRDEADAALRRFPLGGLVAGTVVAIPARARVGVFVDLGDGGRGFVGAEHLPDDPQRWPRIGTRTTFEVLRHDFSRRRRTCQVRLWPAEPRFRRAGPGAGGFSAREWLSVRSRYPIGTVVTATVTRVLPESCCYWIRFGQGRAYVASAAELPPVGAVGRYVVVGTLETTRRLVVAPAGGM